MAHFLLKPTSFTTTTLTTNLICEIFSKATANTSNIPNNEKHETTTMHEPKVAATSELLGRSERR